MNPVPKISTKLTSVAKASRSISHKSQKEQQSCQPHRKPLHAAAKSTAKSEARKHASTQISSTQPSPLLRNRIRVHPILADVRLVKIPRQTPRRVERGAAPPQDPRLLLLVRVQRVAQRLLAVPERQQDVAIRVPLQRLGGRLAVDLGLRFGEPVVPLVRLGRDVRDAGPPGGARDGDGLPQGLGEVVVVVAAGVALHVGVVEGQVPVHGGRQGGDEPVGGVEDDVGGADEDLQGELRVGECDDAEHEQDGAGQRDEAVHLHTHHVVALLRRPVQLAGDVLVAPDHHERPLRVEDDDVAGGDGARGLAAGELQHPFGADADDGGEEGQEDDGEKGHTVLVVYGQHDQDDGHDAAEHGQPGQRAAGGGSHRRVVIVLGEPHAADRVFGQRVPAMEDVGDMVELMANAARLRADDLAGGRGEPLGAGGLDKGLWSGEQAREVAEVGEGADLGVGENGAFAEDGEAVRERRLARVLVEKAGGDCGRECTYKPTMSSWRLVKPPERNFIIFGRVSQDLGLELEAWGSPCDEERFSFEYVRAKIPEAMLSCTA